MIWIRSWDSLKRTWVQRTLDHFTGIDSKRTSQSNCLRLRPVVDETVDRRWLEAEGGNPSPNVKQLLAGSCRLLVSAFGGFGRPLL